MITIEEGLVYHLKNTAAITALVGQRVYPLRIAQGSAMPCIVVSRVSTQRILTHDTTGASGTAHPRFQFDAWASTYAAAKAITDALRGVLNGYAGAMGDPTGSPVTVQGAYVDAEEPEYSEDIGLYRSRSDYIIWHTE